MFVSDNNCLGLPMIIMATCYILIFHQVRTTRLCLEEYGVVAYHIKKRERNFSRMLITIFSKYKWLISTVLTHYPLISSYIFCTFPAILMSWNDKTNMFFMSKQVTVFQVEPILWSGILLFLFRLRTGWTAWSTCWRWRPSPRILFSMSCPTSTTGGCIYIFTLD